jgi:hypothetical protein
VFFAANPHVRRGLDSDPHAAAPQFHDADHDVIADDHRFPEFPRQDQHDFLQSRWDFQNNLAAPGSACRTPESMTNCCECPMNARQKIGEIQIDEFDRSGARARGYDPNSGEFRNNFRRNPRQNY